MNLLDLPVEVFQGIVNSLVDDVGIEVAYQSRGACKTMDRFICQEIFTRQPLEAFDVRRSRFLKENLPKYLAWHAHTRLLNRSTETSIFSNLVHTTTTVFATNSPMPVSETRYWHIRQEVAEVIIKYSKVNVYKAILGKASESRQLRNYSPDSPNEAALFIAIGMENQDLLRQAIASGANIWRKSCIFGPPIAVAMATKNLSLTRSVLQCSLPQICGEPQHIIKRNISSYIVTLDLQSHRGFWGTLRPQGYREHLGYEQVLIEIMEWFLANLGKPNFRTHEIFVEWALTFNNLDLLRQLTDIPLRANAAGRDILYPRAFFTHYSKPSAEALELLVQKGFLKLDKIYDFSRDFFYGGLYMKLSVLEFLVRMRLMATVQKALDMGANPDGVLVPGQSSSYDHLPLITALRAAMSDDDSIHIVKLLLAKGADPDIGNPPANKLCPYGIIEHNAFSSADKAKAVVRLLGKALTKKVKHQWFHYNVNKAHLPCYREHAHPKAMQEIRAMLKARREHRRNTTNIIDVLEIPD